MSQPRKRRRPILVLLFVLSALVAGLPAGFDVPMVLVMHVLSGQPSRLAEVLDAQTPLEVRELDEQEPLRPGRLLVAPPGYHVLVERQGLSEADAYGRMRKTAMDRGLKLGDVAQRILDVADLLG